MTWAIWNLLNYAMPSSAISPCQFIPASSSVSSTPCQPAWHLLYTCLTPALWPLWQSTWSMAGMTANQRRVYIWTNQEQGNIICRCMFDLINMFTWSREAAFYLDNNMKDLWYILYYKVKILLYNVDMDLLCYCEGFHQGNHLVFRPYFI